MPNLKRNLWLFYVINFLSNFWFFTPIAALYFAKQGGSATAAMTVFATMHITTSFFEIPTGVLGDKMSRKGVLILSSVFALIPVTIYAFSTNLQMLLIGAALAGFGNALSSGTGAAMAYETVKQLGRGKDFKKINAIWHTAFPASIGIASLIGGWLAISSLRLPYLVSIGTGVLYVIASCFLVEPKMEENHQDQSWFNHTKDSIIYLFTHKTQLYILGIASLGWAISIQVMYKSISLLYESGGMPLLYFGIMGTLCEIASATGMLSSHYVAKLWSEKSVLFVNTTISILCWYAATFASGIWIGVSVALALFLLGMRVPIITHIMQIYIPDDKRATVLSIRNIVFTIITSVAALVLGVLIDSYDPQFAYRVMTSVLILMLVFIALLPKEASHPQSG